MKDDKLIFVGFKVSETLIKEFDKIASSQMRTRSGQLKWIVTEIVRKNKFNGERKFNWDELDK